MGYPAIVDDPWNYDFEGEDVQILSPRTVHHSG
jgi:hypothetical protein